MGCTHLDFVWVCIVLVDLQGLADGRTHGAARLLGVDVACAHVRRLVLLEVGEGLPRLDLLRGGHFERSGNEDGHVTAGYVAEHAY